MNNLKEVLELIDDIYSYRVCEIGYDSEYDSILTSLKELKEILGLDKWNEVKEIV